MIVSFATRATEDIFQGVDSKAARRALPGDLHALSLPGLRLEKLRGDRAGQHSVRINAQYRVCFRWTAEGPADVEVIDYH